MSTETQPRGRRRRRWIPALALCAGGGSLALAWPRIAGPDSDRVSTLVGLPRSRQLASIRRRMDVSAMDAFLAEQRERATRTGDPIEWQVLAETCLERVLLEAAPMGMAVGRPVFAKRPEIVDTLLADGLQAITEVRDLGRRHSEVGRIAAGLLANKIDGALAAMRYGRQVDAFLSEAEAFADGNPHIAVARGCRLLFAPRWLGGDPERALNLFESAAHALPEDERPLVFAAFAAHLQGDVARAQRSLRDAVACNPDNAYAREVLRRIQAGEADVFGRSLDG